MANAKSGSIVLSFEIYRGDEHLRTEEISQESVTIGKGPAAMLRIEDEALAELHAVINVNDDGSVQLLDLGGPGGTVVNDESVQNSNLQHGDNIRIGECRIVISIIDSEAFAEESSTQIVGPEEDEEEVTHNVDETDSSHGSNDTDDQLEAEISEDVMAFLMRSGATSGGSGIDLTKPKVLEVAEVWGDTVLEIKHFGKAGPPVTAGTSTGFRWRFIGIPIAWVPRAFASLTTLMGPTLSESEEEWKNDYYVPTSCLPHDDYDLFEWEGTKNDGQYVCNISDKWSGFVDIGEERHSFNDLIESGRAQAAGPGQFQVPVTDDTRIIADLGEVVFFGQMVHSSKKVVVPFGKNIDAPFLAIMEFFMFLMGGIITYIELNRDSVTAIVIDTDDFFEEAQQDLEEQEEIEEELVQEDQLAEDAEPEDEEAGEARIDEEGLTGVPDALLEETRGNPENLADETTDMEAVDDAGIFGAMDDLGAEAGSSNTGLDNVGPVGTNIGVLGTQRGTHGFGTRGTGSGGGGSSVTGVGQGTHGRGTGRAGYGQGGGGGGGRRSASVAAVSDDAFVLGAYPREWVFEVIQDNISKFAYCYTRQLTRNPNLQGDISVMFTISGDGSVAQANTANTTMNNSAVESCVNTQMRTLTFPPHPGGPSNFASVTYPFAFSLPEE